MSYQNFFDKTENDIEANHNLNSLANWTRNKKPELYLNEYFRILNSSTTHIRKAGKSNVNRIREKTPNNIRTLLGNIYNGLCQICRFTFRKKGGIPYYEIHHLDPDIGHHPKNLILVCANCHCQFEYANVEARYNKASWLVKVKFNESEYDVNQVVLNEGPFDFKKTVYL